MIIPKLQPVKGKKTFDRIFKTGQRFYHDEASAVICFSRESKEIPLINYAVLVRKKVAKKAVVRNRIKRLMRESLKHIFFESADIKFINSFEYIVIGWNSAPKHPMLIHLNDVLPKVKTLLDKAFKANTKLIEENGN